jgi:protein ImuB
VDRLACVDVPGLPLQLLLRRHTDWRGKPAAVVDHDKPQGVILWINEQARAAGVLPGMRYGAALSLAGDLRAGEVPEQEIAAEVAELVKCLQKFSPDVEPAAGEPGVFWLDARGLERLWPSASHWARDISRTLAERGSLSTVVVGTTRFGTYAVTRGRPCKVTVFTGPVQERAAARRVPLERLDLDPRDRDDLIKLGVRDVGGLLELPPDGLRRAFGPELHRLHELARGAQVPLTPADAPAPAVNQVHFDFPETDTTRLTFEVKTLLHPLLALLHRRGEGLTELELRLTLEGAPARAEMLRTAAPTLDAAQVIDLVRLRLEALQLGGGVTTVELEAVGAPASTEQLALFETKPRRDPRAAERAVARLRATYGDASAVRAELRDGHLPQASFVWDSKQTRCAEAKKPRPRPAQLPLIRRVHAPRPLNDHAVEERDGWRIGSVHNGRVVRCDGPYVISGGWWASEVHREYHFAETERGDLLWIFYDRKRRRWYLQGRVE